MAFTTRYDGQIIIAENPTDMVFGTIMLGDAFGSVISANIIRDADVDTLLKAGSFLAAIMTNPRFEFEFETMFSDNVDPPELAQDIEFPFAGITGRVMPPITVDWKEKGHRGLKIKATSWDSLGSEGAGNAYTFNGTVYTPMTFGV